MGLLLSGGRERSRQPPPDAWISWGGEKSLGEQRGDYRWLEIGAMG
jgi:hypothetical protein